MSFFRRTRNTLTDLPTVIGMLLSLTLLMGIGFLLRDRAEKRVSDWKIDRLRASLWEAGDAIGEQNGENLKKALFSLPLDDTAREILLAHLEDGGELSGEAESLFYRLSCERAEDPASYADLIGREVGELTRPYAFFDRASERSFFGESVEEIPSFQLSVIRDRTRKVFGEWAGMLNWRMSADGSRYAAENANVSIVFSAGGQRVESFFFLHTADPRERYGERILAERALGWFAKLEPDNTVRLGEALFSGGFVTFPVTDTKGERIITMDLAGRLWLITSSAFLENGE